MAKVIKKLYLVDNNRGMTKTVFIFFFSLIYFAGFSQNAVNVGPQISLGSNSFSADGGIGFGVSGEFIHHLKNEGALRVYLGYYAFHYYTAQHDVVGFSPIRIGYQYFLFNKKFTVFADAGGGLFYHTFYNFVTSVGAGGAYIFNFNKKHFMQLSAIYNYNFKQKINNSSWVDVRVAYGLNFGKLKK